MKQQANPELEEKLKRYKKSQSMGELRQFKTKNKKPNEQNPKDGDVIHKAPDQIYPIFHIPTGVAIPSSTGTESG
jgi:hypothetical protein